MSPVLRRAGEKQKPLRASMASIRDYGGTSWWNAGTCTGSSYAADTHEVPAEVPFGPLLLGDQSRTLHDMTSVTAGLRVSRLRESGGGRDRSGT